MRRHLTTRELVLLGVLAVLLLVSGYLMLFYLPMTAELDRLNADAELCSLELETVRLRVEEKHRMERELEALFARPEPPQALPAYDNLRQVMFELNTVLGPTKGYALSFGTVDSAQSPVYRSISFSFTGTDYQQVQTVLRKLRDSAYRSILDDLRLSFADGVQGEVTVNGSIVYFESVPRTN